MKSLQSIFDIDWKLRVLIEASAGTGKTFTIVGLFVRLLAEKNLKIDQILVMTFTKKATAELRDRIFARLQDCLAVLEGTYADEPDLFLQEFAETFRSQSRVKDTIRESIKNFDENQVTTIHGFCQKVLSDEALSAGTPFEVQVAQQDELLTRATEDYWRNFIHQHSDSEAGRYLISKLLDLSKKPEDLKDCIRPLLSKPYAEIEGETLENPKEYLADVITLRRELTECWKREKDSIKEILKTCVHSNYQRYLPGRLNHLEDFVEDKQYAFDQPSSLRFFTDEYLFSNDNLSKKNRDKFPSPHHFFELCTAYKEFTEDIDNVKTTLLYESAQKIKQLREELAQVSGTVTYDDMLINVKQALENPVTGKELAQSLAKKYPFALVDEFQDTDPIQYQIFQKIYDEANGEGSSLCMIGDPKQAIYAFRGADVYTYLKARGEAGDHVFTLEKNYRSTPRIIQAVNHLFNGDQQPFLEEKIDYFESKAGLSIEKTPFLIDGKPADQMHINIKTGLEKKKEPGREFAVSHTVHEIARLIELGESGRATIEGESLRAGDIAVLVNTHAEAASIKEHLKDAGIDSVTYSKQKVFDTFEADRLEMALAAILNPHDPRCFNSALLSGLFGYDLSDLLELKENEEKRLQMVQELQDLYEIWEKRGIYPMFRRFLFDSGRLENLAELDDAERAITNLFQIAEICAEDENTEEHNPHSLFTWFRGEKRDPGEGDENTLMLESDQNLVKISTIHNSKGLQYPVVFCPYLWDYKVNKGSIQDYHAEGDHQYRINIDQKRNDAYEVAVRQSTFESIAEDVRKAYVAVTRAQFYIDVCWVNHKESNLSGLGALLTGAKSVKASIENSIKISDSGNQDAHYFPHLIKGCADKSEDSILLHFDDDTSGTDEVLANTAVEEDENLFLRPYLGRDTISIRQTVSSFSSINRHSGVDVYEPDYDQVMESYAGAFEVRPSESKERSIFTFPRGATAGTAIHKLFEDEKFSFRDAQNTDYTDMINEVLTRHGFDSEWASVAATMMKNVCNAAIPGLNLSDVEEQDQLREMEFLFRANSSDAESLYPIIRDGQMGPVFGNPEDFMTGFIDLVVRQNGRYFILDYKSNHLGDQVEDYSSEKLKTEIETNGYDLQYHLYTLALVKFLKKRLPEFDYETHFGGVAYLFVRGIRKGEANGVWFHKPEKEIIANLNEVLGGNR